MRVGDFADLRGNATQKVSKAAAGLVTSEELQRRAVAATANFALRVDGLLDGRQKSRPVFGKQLGGQRSFDHFAAKIAIVALGSDSPGRTRKRDVVRVAAGLGQGVEEQSSSIRASPQSLPR